MDLGELLEAARHVWGDGFGADGIGAPGIDVTGITYDSRRVVPGDLFCCLTGTLADGHDHAQEAVAVQSLGYPVCLSQNQGRGVIESFS